MKITFLVSHLLSGGAERTVSYLSSHMADMGWDVTVLNITGEAFYELNPRVKHVKLGIPISSKSLISRLSGAWERKTKIEKYIKNNRPDAIFCMLYYVTKYVLGVCKKYKIKLISSERILPEAITEKRKIRTRHRAFSASDAIIFQTERAKAYFSDSLQKKGRVIHNAVGNPLVYSCSIPEVREKKITAVGRLDHQKDYPTLIKAFSIVAREYPDYTLEIFGVGPCKEMLKAVADEMGVSDKVIFKGSHIDAIKQISSASMYVMSSKFEGMPNALMEAMAVGLPCISTDCPNGPAELITSGENGILVPVGDVDALAKAILRFIEDPEFAESCGAEAKKILDTHSVENIASQYCEFIKETVNKEQK